MTLHKKICFEFDNDEGGTEVETIWAVERPDGYEVDNIPFYVQSVACGDVVAARPDKDGRLTFTGLVRASGHSTVRLLFAREEDVGAVREELERRGCSSEVSDVSRLVAVDVPPVVPYQDIKSYLDDGERAGTFEYEEGCLGSGAAAG